MLILLPPSEGKSAPRRGRPLSLDRLSFPELTEARVSMLEALVDLCQKPDAASTLGLGPTQADQVARNAALRQAPTARADRIYSGVLYEALDLAGLEAEARRRAGRWLLVTSSLFGLVHPGDHIPAYRLSGGVSLPGIGTVSSYWSKRLHSSIVAAAGQGAVVDLRSSTYTAFWRPSRTLADRVVSVRVLHEHQGTRKVVSHFNKATKGRLVRSLLQDGSTPATPHELAEMLKDLGWAVEDGPKPGVFDVVVDSF